MAPIFCEVGVLCMEIRYVSPCLLGMETFIAGELRGMGASNVQAENGRVLFSGDETMLARANICSRYSERIQILIGSFRAVSFEELFQGVKALPWEQWIGEKDAFPVKGYSINSTLFSVSDCQSIIKKAVVERLKQKYKIPWFEESGPVYQIQFSIMKDHVSLLIDTSGTALHKRGYRLSANEAPLKETLAAAICYLARLYDDSTVYDPFCGSGTLLIESVLLAHNIAPGLRRGFSAEQWRNIPADVWTKERERAQDLIKKDTAFLAVGSDIDERALELTQINAKRAGVASKIKLHRADISDFHPETERGVVLCNPPYGERMLDIKEAQLIYEKMGEVFVRRKGYSYTIISPDENFEALFGRPADKRRKLYNGMKKCQIFMYYKAK